MATAELAMVIPAVLMVLALCLSALTLAVDQIRCVDAARAAARAASRGEELSQVHRVAQSLTPSGSSVSVSFVDAADAPHGVQVVVTAPRRMRWLPALPVPSARAGAPLEPVVTGP